MTAQRPPGIATRAVHAGEQHGSVNVRPTATPIHNASSYLAPSVAEIDGILSGDTPGFVYTRDGNPTVAAFERAVASLEGTDGAAAFGSGMAALHAALVAAGAQQGARIVASRDCYGRTRSLLLRLVADAGLSVDFVDLDDASTLERLIVPPIAGLIVETLSNPLVKVADIARLAELVHAAQGRLIVDSTFATPVLNRPAELGADLVVHSATKYLGGHGDVTAGVVCANDDLLPAVRSVASLFGGILGPNEAWLCLRGLKTLPLRMERQSANAALIARHLSLHARVQTVHYPGLPNHPGHRLAQELFGGRFGAIIAVELRDAGRAEVLAFMERLRLVLPAPTLGDVATLVSYPAQSSHRALSPEQRAEQGISDALVRLSIGIEDINDIIADLEQALA